MCTQKTISIHISSLYYKLNAAGENGVLLLLPNTDRLQQVEDYVRCCTWQLKTVITINMFHKVVCDRGDIRLQRFNRVTQNNCLVAVGCSQISYEGKQLLSLLRLTRRNNEEREMHVP